MRTATASALAVTCAPSFVCAEKGEGKPNIIVIMADDISAKEFPTYRIPDPTYGDGPCVTPVMEDMKNNGVQFAIGWATPLCHPSRGMIMTGRYASRTQWWSNGYGPAEGEANHALYESHLTLGQMAKRAGYATQFVGKWQLGGTPAGYAFDEYVFTPGQFAARAPAEEKMNGAGKGKPSFYWNPGYSLRNHPDYPDSSGTKGQTFKTTWKDFAADIELKFIKNFMKRKHETDQPFFVYWPAHLGHPNWDYDNDGMGYPGVPPMDERLYPRTQKIKTTASDGTVVEKTPPGINYHVQYLDYCLGELITQTETLGIDKNAIIIFTTDNATTEYGKGLKGAVREHGPRVPMIVCGPGLVEARGEVDDLASLVDIAPTVAELTATELPEGYEFDGKSMMPFVSGRASKHRGWVYSYNAEYQMVRTRNVCRDGMGFYWDTRDTRDQEQYKLMDENKPDPALCEEVELITTVLEKYPPAPLSGPMYERYMKAKEGKREFWDKIRERVLRENKERR
jgi:arylsulfatase A-like enzyme